MPCSLSFIMRRKAVQPNGWFGTNEWLPRKIDMILWTFRNSGPCTTVQRTPDQLDQIPV